MSATGVLDDPEVGTIGAPDRAATAADGPEAADSGASDGAAAAPRRPRLAFVAHTGGRIALRPIGPVPANVRFPQGLGPGDRLGELSFAELAEAFRGVVEVDPATGEAAIVSRAPEGAPRRLRFRVDGRGVVALRGLDGHPWSEEVPRGRPAFGVPAETLAKAGEGVLELEPAGLEARLVEPAPAAPAAPGRRPAVAAPPRRPAATPPTRAAPAEAEPEPDAAREPRAVREPHAAPRRRRPALAAGVLLLLAAAGGVAAGWWFYGDRVGDWARRYADSAAVEPVAPPPASPAEPGPVGEGAAIPAVPTMPAEPRRPGPPGGGIAAGDDPVAVVEALARMVGDPALAGELGGVAAALRRERQAREEERGRAAAAAIAAGAQLARVYRRDAADLRRLETAAGVCGEDAACRGRYGPALARAATARDLTRDAYVRLLGQVAADYPQDLLERELGAAAPVGGTARGKPDEGAALDDLARRFVEQVARLRGGGAAAAGEVEALVGELLEGGPAAGQAAEPLLPREGAEP